MATEVLDCMGLKCPIPTTKVTVLATRLKPGDIIDVKADCPTFEKDLRDWSSRTKKTILWIREEGGGKRTQVKV
jgi:tRNA 2-thiouridine synthesizing protein A